MASVAGALALLFTCVVTLAVVEVESIPGLNVHCAVRKEISPCTCRHQEQMPRGKKAITVICEGMTSFEQVIVALKGRFDKNVDIRLRISHSVLDDLPQLQFHNMGLHITQLTLMQNNLTALPESVFMGLGDTELVSLPDNFLETIPRNVLNLMPKVKTLDISRAYIANITSKDLANLQGLTTLILSTNNISLLEKNAFPATVNKLHIGRNKIKHLNGTLRVLPDLEWLFINNNQIESLESELPETRPNKKLSMIHAMHNRLTGLPQELLHFQALDYIDLEGNKLKRLSGVLSRASRMTFLNLFNNQIDLLESGDFAAMENLTELKLDHNRITSLNGSILPLKSLVKLTVSNNLLFEFNPNELRGLTRLKKVDFSFNIIQEIAPKILENQVDRDPPQITELKLDNNQLKKLSGSLGLCITGLRRLNISHNLIEALTPQDFLGFNRLQILDISHNRLTTFGDYYLTLVPTLENIKATHNLLSSLEKELYGFPYLCWADFSYNQLTDISLELADKTTCQIYGVNSTLRVYLHGNTGICSKEVLSKRVEIEEHHSMEFHGFEDCPKQE